MSSLAEMLGLAERAYREGALDEVARLCRQVLEAAPGQPDAQRFLGVVALRQGRPPEAVDWLSAVAASTAGDPDAHSNLGLALYASGRVDAAADSFARALALRPDHAGARPYLLDAALRRGTAPAPQWLEALLAPPPRIDRFQIEITTWCNLKCAECSRTVAIDAGRWANKHMRLEDFRRIIDHSLPGAILVLQGIGEPTLHPALIDMLAIARSSGKFRGITFNSNAIGRGIEFYALAKATGLTHLSVSVDSFDQAVADLCRFGTRVEKLARRVEELRRLFPNLVVSIVASRLNLEDIPRTVARLAAIGVADVEIQPLINYQPAAGSNADNSLTGAAQARLRTLIAGARRDHPALRIQLASALDGAEAGPRCLRPFLSPYVTVDGFLTPCCTCFDPAVWGHTSVIELPMRDAWVRPGVRDWLLRYFSSEPAICVGCCFNPRSAAPAS